MEQLSDNLFGQGLENDSIHMWFFQGQHLRHEQTLERVESFWPRFKSATPSVVVHSVLGNLCSGHLGHLTPVSILQPVEILYIVGQV